MYSQFLQRVHCVPEITPHSDCFRHLCHCHLLTYLRDIRNISCSSCDMKAMNVNVHTLWTLCHLRQHSTTQTDTDFFFVHLFECQLGYSSKCMCSIHSFIECYCCLLPFDFLRCSVTGSSTSHRHDSQNSLLVRHQQGDPASSAGAQSGLDWATLQFYPVKTTALNYETRCLILSLWKQIN